MPVPVPRILGHADDLGVLALEDLGDVTLQAHLGAAPPAEHAALYRQAVAFIDVIQRRGRELAESAYLPYGIAFDVEKLTWEMDFFIKHFLEAYRGAALAAGEREALRAELGAIVDRAGGRAARALPSRLPQPQPDAGATAGCASSTFRTRASGPTPTTSSRCCATRTSTCRNAWSTSSSRTSSRCSGRTGDARRVPPALRPDGAAAQPEGARHVRLSDDRARAIPSTFSTSRARCATRARTC